MFLFGAVIRFGKFAVIFLFVIAVIWLIYRGGSFVIRWLLDQLGIETNEIKSWIKSKLPKRKKKSNKFSISDLSEEEIEELRTLLKR